MDKQQATSCESCYNRKTRCTTTATDADPICDACAAGGFECVKRMKSKLGRPKGSRKHSWRLPRPSVSEHVHSPAYLVKATMPAASSNAATITANAHSTTLPVSSDTHPFPGWLQEGLPDFDSLGMFDLPPELLLSPGTGASSVSTESLNSIALSPQGRTVFMQTFRLHLQLHNIPSDGLLSQEHKNNLLQTIEDLSELTLSLSPSPSHPCFDVLISCGNEVQTLLFLFLTVITAVNACERLLPRSDDASTTPSSGSTIEWPFTGIYHDSTLPFTSTSLVPDAMDNMWLPSFPENQPTYHHKSRTLSLTRLDIILYDLSLFSKTMSHLAVDADMQQHTTPELLTELHQQNEKCLLALKRLHGQVHAHLEMIRPDWDGAHSADESITY